MLTEAGGGHPRGHSAFLTISRQANVTAGALGLVTDEQQQVDRCKFGVHWSHLCTCSLAYLLSPNYNPWAGDLCHGLSLHWTLLERMHFQNCSLPVLSRTLRSSLFS